MVETISSVNYSYPFSNKENVMTDESNDPLKFIDTLLSTPHPSEERLWMFSEGKITKGTEPELIRQHLTMCSSCKELAHLFGWPTSNTKH
jgi:hypothetical protein